MKMKRPTLLVEAVGSPAWPTLLPALREVAGRIVALEVDPTAVGAALVDRCLRVPPYRSLSGPELFLDLCRREGVDVVLPSIHEGLPFWSQHRARFEACGSAVPLSPPETLAITADKWETYQFFRSRGIPTPATSLAHDFELIKPRVGRGGAGIRIEAPSGRALPEGVLSQQLLCARDGSVVALVQRERLAIESGLAIKARVLREPRVEREARRLLAELHCFGIVNLQCFLAEDGSVRFTEVNPRIPGGLSLSLAATQNWFALLLELLRGDAVEPLPAPRELWMLRHWSDVFCETPPQIAELPDDSDVPRAESAAA
jgi:carbamoyl-phosphate synthase large subunit